MSSQNIYSDESIFKYGTKFRGKKFGEIPAWYWMWVHDNKMFQMDLSLHAYIADNMDCFKLELKKK